MKRQRAISIITPLSFFELALVVLMPPKFTQADRLKRHIPSDVNKKAHKLQDSSACWFTDDASMQ